MRLWKLDAPKGTHSFDRLFGGIFWWLQFVTVSAIELNWIFFLHQIVRNVRFYSVCIYPSFFSSCKSQSLMMSYNNISKIIVHNSSPSEWSLGESACRVCLLIFGILCIMYLCVSNINICIFLGNIAVISSTSNQGRNTR